MWYYLVDKTTGALVSETDRDPAGKVDDKRFEIVERETRFDGETEVWADDKREFEARPAPVKNPRETAVDALLDKDPDAWTASEQRHAMALILRYLLKGSVR